MIKALEKTKNIYRSIDKKIEKINNNFIDFLSKKGHFVFMGVVLIAFFLATYGMRNVVTGDMSNFLYSWYRNFYENGAAALGQNIGDYTPSYMYFLWFVSLFKVSPDLVISETEISVDLVYWIKAYSIIYQIVASIFIYKIVKHLTNNSWLSSLGFAFGLFAPALLLNSGFWGQCDAIFTCFIVISLYYLLKKKPILATVFVSFAFCFKLQTIFFIPVLLVLYLQKQYKLRYLLLIPIIYIIVAMPSVMCGRSLKDILLIYVNQSGNSYKQLALNCSTFWSLIFRNFWDNQYLESAAIMTALVATGSLIFGLFKCKIDLSNKKTLVKVAFMFALAMPYFMPHMHDRYYYLADLLAIIYLITNLKKAYIPLLSSLVSLGGYTAYLWSFNIFYTTGQTSDVETSFRIGAIIMAFVLFQIIKDVFSSPKIDENILLS